MDIRDDPSATTTTTDYDSGDSEDVEYVYEGHGRAKRKDNKGRCPGRKRSPRTRARRAGTVDENAEITVSEEDTDVEHEERSQKHSRRPRKPSGSGGVTECHGCHDKVNGKAEKKKSTEKLKKSRATWVPYIEEYPDEAPRPAIRLKEHKISRRSSTSDAKHMRDSGGSSLSAGSRGGSPTAKRLPQRSHRRRPSKESSIHSEQYSRRPDLRETHTDEPLDYDARSFQDDSDETSLATRHPRHVAGPELTNPVSRSSAWPGSPQLEYSSSWPLNASSRMPQRKPARLQQHRYDSEEEDEGPEDYSEDDNTYIEQHAQRRVRPASFHERDRDRDAPYRVSPPPQREHVRSPPPRQQPRRQTIADTGSIATMDQDRRSVAASTVYEVWRGRAEDWESPYVSAVDDEDEDPDSEVEETFRLLSLDDIPPRTSSPHLLPPRGERRGNFAFQSDTRSPPPRYHHHHHHLSVYGRGPSPFPSAIRGISHNPTWDDDGDDGLTGSNQRPLLLLLDAPGALTMEADAMTDEEGDNNNSNTQQPPSRASRWSNTRDAWDDSPPHLRLPAAAGGGAARGRPFKHPLALPRPRAVSPVLFSARETREAFLSPQPTRAAAARFDFGAWGCDRASRSSVALGLL